MALSGSLNTSTWYGTSQNGALQFSWSATQSIDGNTSTISWTLKGVVNESWIMAGGFKVVIDGDTVYSKDTDYRIKLYNGTVVASGTKTLSHNMDGTRSFGVSIQGGIYTFAVNVTGSTTFNLDTIPRASSISVTTANIESNPTITINRASSSFTHTVTYSFGSLTGTIATKTGATSITSWTIPTSFYAQIPNAKTGSGTLTCITYNGGTEVGRSTARLDVATDEAKCKPTVSGTVVDTNATTIALTGNKNTLVRYFSTALCTITATLNKNAGSILAKTINNTPITGNTLTIANVETGVFDFYAKDSREYPGSAKVTKNIVLYERLTNNATAQRTEPTTGKATISLEGTYFNGSFGATSNSLTVKYRQGSGSYVTVTPSISGNKYTATVSLTGLDYTKSYTYEVVVSDKLNTVSKTLTINKGIPVFDWGENDFSFNVPVNINAGINIAPEDGAAAIGDEENRVALTYIVAQGTSGTWTYRKWSDGLAELWGICKTTHANGSVLGGRLTYPFLLKGTVYAIGTLNSAGGNSGGALPWNLKITYGLDLCEAWVHNPGNVGFTESSSVDVSVYVVGKWK